MYLITFLPCGTKFLVNQSSEEEAFKSAVKAKVLKNGKGKKITIFTYKPKKNEKRKMGHRQPYTKVEITSIKA